MAFDEITHYVDYEAKQASLWNKPIKLAFL